jgi:hypothetical protein
MVILRAGLGIPALASLSPRRPPLAGLESQGRLHHQSLPCTAHAVQVAQEVGSEQDVQRGAQPLVLQLLANAAPHGDLVGSKAWFCALGRPSIRACRMRLSTGRAWSGSWCCQLGCLCPLGRSAECASSLLGPFCGDAGAHYASRDVGRGVCMEVAYGCGDWSRLTLQPWPAPVGRWASHGHQQRPCQWRRVQQLHVHVPRRSLRRHYTYGLRTTHTGSRS